MNRRAFLAWTAQLPLWSSPLAADEELVPFSDYAPQFAIEAKADHPRVKCFDLRRLTSAIPATGDHFAFHQTQTVRVDATSWRLRIGGRVKRPAEFTLQELLNREDRRDSPVTIECSGNSGDPQIMNGLVSTAVWTGVSLATLLQEAGIEADAREVVFLGSDTEDERKWEAGNQPFPSPHGRSMFVQDALAPENLLAFAMNGKPLPEEHGFPLRLVLPGWYGMAQVKWLTRIEVIDRRYEGRHMARNYQSLHAVNSPGGTFWLDTSISRNNLKSVVCRVTKRRFGSAFQYKIMGAAWGGAAPISTVEVQVDQTPWQSATIDRRNGNAVWVLWSLDWNDATPGPHSVVSRATDGRGEVQPTREELRTRLISNREDNAQWRRAIVV